MNVDATEAVGWVHDAWTIEELREGLREFGVELTHSTLRSLLADLGIRPAIKMGSRASGRGVVGYHDPLVAWVIAVVQHRGDASSMAELKARLDECRDAAEEAVWGDLAYRPRQRDEFTALAWGWRVESVACYLFMTDLRHGSDLRLLHEWLSTKPWLLEYTLDSNMCLEGVLRAYASRLISMTTHANVKPEDVNFFEGDKKPLYSKQFNGTDTLGFLERYRIQGWPGGREHQILKAENDTWRGPAHLVEEADPGALAPKTSSSRPLSEWDAFRTEE